MTLQSDLRAEHPGTSGHEAAGPRTAHQDGFGRNATGPLAGIVVADFSRVLAGPCCTMLLADMGATVLKLEGPGGDERRAWTPPVRDRESTCCMSINRNKRAISLDFAPPSGSATAAAGAGSSRSTS